MADAYLQAKAEMENVAAGRTEEVSKARKFTSIPSPEHAAGEGQLG